MKQGDVPAGPPAAREPTVLWGKDEEKAGMNMQIKSTASEELIELSDDDDDEPVHPFTNIGNKQANVQNADSDDDCIIVTDSSCSNAEQKEAAVTSRGLEATATEYRHSVGSCKADTGGAERYQEMKYSSPASSSKENQEHVLELRKTPRGGEKLGDFSRSFHPDGNEAIVLSSTLGSGGNRSGVRDKSLIASAGNSTTGGVQRAAPSLLIAGEVKVAGTLALVKDDTPNAPCGNAEDSEAHMKMLLADSIAEFHKLAAQQDHRTLPLTPATRPPFRKTRLASELQLPWGVCPYRGCDATFKNVFKCEEHLDTKHLRVEMNAELAKQQAVRGLDPSGIECPENNCGYMAPLRNDLIRHFNMVHSKLRLYLKRRMDKIPGANFDQLRANGYFRRKHRRQQLVTCEHCDLMVAEKHRKGHVIYKHFLAFYQTRISTEQADFGCEPGICPGVSCGKNFKMKASQADLLMKHYEAQHFSVEEAARIFPPVLQQLPVPLVELDEDVHTKKEEETDSQSFFGSSDVVFAGCPIGGGRLNGGCGQTFRLNTEGYAEKIWKHLADHYPSRDLLGEVIGAAQRAYNQQQAGGNRCPLHYCRETQSTSMTLERHFRCWHLLELVVTALTLHWRPSDLLTRLLKNMPYQHYHYFVRLKKSLVMSGAPLSTNQAVATAAATVGSEAVETVPDISSLFPDIEIVKEEKPSLIEANDQSNDHESDLNENPGSSELEAVLYDPRPEPLPSQASGSENLSLLTTSPNLRSDRTDGSIKSKLTPSVPAPLLQYLNDSPDQYSRQFLASGGRAMAKPLLSRLQADLLRGIKGATPGPSSISNIQEITTYLCSRDTSFTEEVWRASSFPDSKDLDLFRAQASLLTSILAQYQHLDRVARHAYRAINAKVAADIPDATNETKHRLVDIVWSLLFRQPYETLPKEVDEDGDNCSDRAGWQCSVCPAAFLAQSADEAARHCAEASHSGVTCSLCAEEVTMGNIGILAAAEAWKVALEVHCGGPRHSRRQKVLDSYTAAGLNICQAEPSVEEHLKLSRFLEDLNRNSLLLEGLNFLRVYLCIPDGVYERLLEKCGPILQNATERPRPAEEMHRSRAGTSSEQELRQSSPKGILKNSPLVAKITLGTGLQPSRLECKQCSLTFPHSMALKQHKRKRHADVTETSAEEPSTKAARSSVPQSSPELAPPPARSRGRVGDDLTTASDSDSEAENLRLKIKILKEEFMNRMAELEQHLPKHNPQV